MGIRKEQKENRKNDIIACALELFATKGYSETKITDIAKSVNMSVGLLFHYFNSKEELYSELLLQGIDLIKEKTTNLVKEPLGYFECAMEMIINMIRDSLQFAQMYKLIRNATKTNAIPIELKMNIKSVFSEFFQLNEKKIIMGQAQGTIKTGDSKALTMALFSCIDGVVEAYLVNPKMPLPESSWIVDIIKKH